MNLAHLIRSLRFKVTLLVIMVELLVFTGVGVFYTRRFSQEIDKAIIARLSIPGLLMTRGELSFEAVSDRRTMEGLLREPYSEGIVIGLDGLVYFSSDPARQDTHLEVIDGLRLSGPESSIFSADTPDRITPVQDSTGKYLTCLSPLRPNGKLTGYLYLKVGTEISEAEKRNVSILFAVGSLVTISLTAPILSLLLHWMVIRRLNYLVEVFRRFARGDYAARAQALGGDDEITTLMSGFNGLAKRLEDTMAHLSESESRFRVLVEHAPEAIVVYDVDAKHFVEANQNAERLFACSLERLRQAGPATFYAPAQPDKIPVEQGVNENLRRVLAGEEVVVERAIINATGQQLLCEVRLVHLPASQRRLIRASYIDITERKRAEEELRRLTLFQQTILNSAPYSIVSATPDGIVTGFNPAAERLLGYTAAEVVGKQTPAIWHDPQEVEQHARQLSAELGEQIPPGFDVFTARPKRHLPEEREWTFIRKDGTRVPVNLSVTALRDDGGHIIGFVGMIYDITERKRNQEVLQRLNEELEHGVKQRTADLQVKSDELQESQRALMNLVEDLNEKAAMQETTNNELAAVNKELESFSYSVSHDLRSPLRAIDGFSRILLEDYKDKLDDAGKDSLTRVRAASQRMGQLIDDLLQLSRLTRAEMCHAPVDLSALAHAAADDLQKTEPGRRVDLSIQPGLTAEADPNLMRVVLENLLGNAWKFTGKQAAAKIEFGRMTAEAVPTFFVRDNGVGFDMTYADKLFGAFQRLHSTTEFPGTGIGLATVQRVIHRHGGRVWAKSTPGHGAAFYFTLPVAETDNSRQGKESKPVTTR